MLEVRVQRQGRWMPVSYPATLADALTDVAAERHGHRPPAVEVLTVRGDARTPLLAWPAEGRPAPITTSGPSPTLR